MCAALRSLKAEPHFMQDETYLRDLRDDEHERDMQAMEDAQPRPSTGTDSGGGEA
jgi:hypothetical protein